MVVHYTVGGDTSVRYKVGDTGGNIDGCVLGRTRGDTVGIIDGGILGYTGTQ